MAHVGMVLHVLKRDPTLKDLKHVQVNGPGMAYLFFFDKQSHQGLTLEATQAMRAHMGEAFAEWISHSAHFTVSPIPLVKGWHHAQATSEWHRHWSKAEYPGWLVPSLASSESDSTPPLLGSAPFPLLRLVQQRTLGVDGLQGCLQPTSEEGLPRPDQQRRMWETHPHPLPTEEGQIQMDTLQ